MKTKNQHARVQCERTIIFLNTQVFEISVERIAIRIAMKNEPPYSDSAIGAFTQVAIDRAIRLRVASVLVGPCPSYLPNPLLRSPEPIQVGARPRLTRCAAPGVSR